MNSHVITMRDIFRPPKGYLWASADFSSQEFRGAGAVANDPNIIQIYKLERDYRLQLIPKPLDPNGNPYKDPRVDPHIIAASALDEEVKRLLEQEPWLCHPDISPIVKKYRQQGKILNYCLPLHTQVLTKNGWRHREQLKIGDLVLGISQETMYEEWTPIIDIYDFEESPLLNIYSELEDFNFICTPNHRWLCRRDGVVTPVETIDITTKDSIITSSCSRDSGLAPYWREVSGESLLIKEVSAQKVFCLSTGNQGFTIKQGRYISHTLNSLIYGASANSLAEDLKTDVNGAQEIIDKYYSYPDGFYKLGEWLKVTALCASERRWVRTPLGGMLFVNDGNSKGMNDVNTTRRKASNAVIQGLSAEQAKVALIYAEAEFEKLNNKYREVLKGREGQIIAIVHDELDALVPGDCYIEKVIIPDPEIPMNNIVKFKCNYDLSIDEHALAWEYANALKDAMERAMKYTFDIIGCDMPPGADVNIAKWWKH